MCERVFTRLREWFDAPFGSGLEWIESLPDLWPSSGSIVGSVANCVVRFGEDIADADAESCSESMCEELSSCRAYEPQSGE